MVAAWSHSRVKRSNRVESGMIPGCTMECARQHVRNRRGGSPRWCQSGFSFATTNASASCRARHGRPAVSGYYSEETVARLLFVRNAIRFGFTSKELAGFLKAREVVVRRATRSVRPASAC